MIDHPALLADLVNELTKAPHIAIDTEANSLFAYRERVCLLQISLPGADFLIDPLALPDLSPLSAFFSDPAREKVFHAAEYDLLCLHRDYGFGLRGLYDTYAAARALGVRTCGLGSLLEMEFGVQLDKRFQRADWSKRPLSEAQLAYASMDTHYLLALRDRLAERVQAAGLEEELNEEFRRLEKIPEEEADTPRYPGFWRIPGVFDMPPRKRAVLHAIYLWRENEAERVDRPPFYILSEKDMIGVAEQLPSNDEELGACDLPASVAMRRGNTLLRIVADHQNDPPPRQPPSHRMDDETADRWKALQNWRKGKALARGVESDVILTKDTMQRIAQKAPRSAEALAAIPGFGPWKQARYSAEILAVLNKETT
jgi:ribonuclease D